MLEYRTLVNLSTPGIWAFINERDRVVYLSQSNNILSSVSRNIDSLLDKSHFCRRMVKDRNNLTLVILEYIEIETDRKLRLNYWIDHYRNKGYNLYRKHNGESVYQPKILITKDYQIHVVLVNKRNDKLVVGVFNKMDEANQFMTSHYSNTFYTITYSDNILTKEYYKRKGSVV